MSRKTKRKQPANSNSISILELLGWGILTIAGFVVCTYIMDLVQMTMFRSYGYNIHPAEINWNNGLPLLFGYGFLMICFIALGYFMAKKIDRTGGLSLG